MAGQADSLKFIPFALFAITATLATGNPLCDAIDTMSIGMVVF